MKLILVATYKARQQGKRGMSVALPASYFHDLAIKPSDIMNVYRDPENWETLIIKPQALDKTSGI